MVLARIREKDEQWRQARLDMNRCWREVVERNYHKSLDQRSSHFKQADKKDLSPKNLLMDILDPEGGMNARAAAFGFLFRMNLEIFRALQYGKKVRLLLTETFSCSLSSVINVAALRGLGERMHHPRFRCL